LIFNFEFSTRSSGRLFLRFYKQHRSVIEQITELEDVKRERVNRVTVIDGFIRELASRPLVIDEFDERLWMVAVEMVTVGVDGEMVFGFKG
jgi:hypothetical protein